MNIAIGQSNIQAQRINFKQKKGNNFYIKR